jgi:ABC-type glycerol-3-phosphate transport system substrate-binding protein
MNRNVRRIGIMFCTLLLLLTVGTAPMLAKELRFLAIGWPLALTDYVNKEVVPAFEAKYGVKVIINTSANWNNRMDKILVSIAGGVPYDLVSTGFYSPIEEGSNGLLAPLDDYLASWSGTKKFPAPIWNTLQWQGKTYVVPQNSAVRVIAYNKALFAQSGLNPEAPPQSWDDLIRYARLLTRMQGDQVTVRGYSSNTGVNAYSQDLFWYMRQAGITEFNVTTFTANLTQQEAFDALNTIIELNDASRTQSPILSGGFAGERIAMERQYSGMQQKAFEQNPNLIPDYGVFLPRRTPTSPPVGHGFFDGIGILSASENKDLAWAFIETIYERDTLEEMERISGFISGNLDLVSRHMRSMPKIDLFYNAYSYVTNSVIPPPRTTSQTELGKLLEQAIKKQMSAREALERAQEIWNRLLSEWQATLR